MLWGIGPGVRASPGGHTLRAGVQVSPPGARHFLLSKKWYVPKSAPHLSVWPGARDFYAYRDRLIPPGKLKPP